MLLERRTPRLEQPEQLRTSVPCSVEHPHPLSPLSDLSSPALALVPGSFLSGAPLPGGYRDVHSGVSLDQQLLSGGSCWHRFRLQWFDVQLSHVAQQHRRARVDAVGHLGSRAWLSEGRPPAAPRRASGGGPTSFRSARNHFVHCLNRRSSVAPERA